MFILVKYFKRRSHKTRLEFSINYNYDGWITSILRTLIMYFNDHDDDVDNTNNVDDSILTTAFVVQ